MRPHHTLRPIFTRFASLALLALCLLPHGLRAQFLVALQMDKVNYIDQESMLATVTVTNRSGADVILGASAGSRNWLTFDITDSTGREFPPLTLPAKDAPIFKAGEAITRKIHIIDAYPANQLGTYSIKASAYHPPTAEFFESNRVRFVVNDQKPYGEPLVIGVPAGYPEAGRTRAYEPLVVRDNEHSYLYMRMRDVKTHENLATYQIAPISLARDPQLTLDGSNFLHALFLAGPKIYVYAIIEPDGHMKSKTIFKELDNSRPQLFRTPTNGVVAQGGQLMDPNSKEATQKKARSLSERPPGL